MSTPEAEVFSRRRVATAAEVRAASAGEVTAARVFDPATGDPVEGGLHDPDIFGSPPRSCTCGRLSGVRNPGMHCTHCGTAAGTPPAIPLAGHVELAAPVVHPLALGRGHGPLRRVLGLPGRALRDLVYGDAEVESLRGAEAVRHLLRRLGDDAPTGVVLDVLPVVPVRFRRPRTDRATGAAVLSPLDRHYRRILRRNARLRKLVPLNPPLVILRNECRLLQQAVDDLFFGCTARRGRRERWCRGLIQTLLPGRAGPLWLPRAGKRSDFSARAVAVPDPRLAPDECVLPRERVALPLFGPLVVGRLLANGGANSRAAAEELVARRDPAALAALDDVTRGRLVLVGRRGHEDADRFRAFVPRLGDDRAIHLPPVAFRNWNLTASGEVVDVHLPLSDAAQAEAGRMRHAPGAQLPRPGHVDTNWTADVALGLLRLTLPPVEASPSWPFYSEKTFCSENLDALRLALACGRVHLRQRIRLRLPHGTPVIQGKDAKGQPETFGFPVRAPIDTTVGRALVNGLLPPGVPHLNDQWNATRLGDRLADVRRVAGADAAADFLRAVGELAREALTASGVSFAIGDCPVPNPGRAEELRKSIASQQRALDRGFISVSEMNAKVWDLQGTFADGARRDVLSALAAECERSRCPSALALAVRTATPVILTTVGRVCCTAGFVYAGGPTRVFITPGLCQGLGVADYWRLAAHERFTAVEQLFDPVVVEYVTHKLDPVLRDTTVTVPDCGTTRGVTVAADARRFFDTDPIRGAAGRVTLRDIPGRDGRTVQARAGDVVPPGVTWWLNRGGELLVRSPITCEAPRGVCQRCHGLDPATGEFPPIGAAVGRRAVFALAHALPGYRRVHRSLIASEESRESREAEERKLTYRLVPQYPGSGDQMPNLFDLLELRARLRAALAKHAGTVIACAQEGRVRSIVVRSDNGRETHHRSECSNLVWDGVRVAAGDALSYGRADLREVAALLGHDRAAAELRLALLALLDYGGGVRDLTTPVELLVRRMAEWVRVGSPGGTRWRAGAVVRRAEWVRAAAGDPGAFASPILVGIHGWSGPPRSRPVPDFGNPSPAAVLGTALVRVAR